MVLFYELDRLKRILNVDDTDEDELLNQLGRGADVTLKDWFLSRQDELPTEDEVTENMRNAVAYKAAARYHVVKENMDTSKFWNDEYKNALADLYLGTDKNRDKEYLLASRY